MNKQKQLSEQIRSQLYLHLKDQIKDQNKLYWPLKRKFYWQIRDSRWDQLLSKHLKVDLHS